MSLYKKGSSVFDSPVTEIPFIMDTIYQNNESKTLLLMFSVRSIVSPTGQAVILVELSSDNFVLDIQTPYNLVGLENTELVERISDLPVLLIVPSKMYYRVTNQSNLSVDSINSNLGFARYI